MGKGASLPQDNRHHARRKTPTDKNQRENIYFLKFFTIFDRQIQKTTMDKPQEENERLKAIGMGIKRGDKNAFHTYYKEYFVRLQEYAVRYVYDYQEAQDIVQDAFLSLWVNSAQYDPQRNVVTYLLVIVKNACINRLRDLRIHDAHRDKIVEAMLFSNLEDPETDPGLQQRLREVLATLPEKGREILLEHFVQHKRISTIAAEMGVAESTIKTHLKRTMKVLRDNLLFILMGI